MYITRIFSVLLRLVCILFLVLAAFGCGLPPERQGTDRRFEQVSFRDVAGITAGEISAIERVISQREEFVYAMTGSSEAFVLDDGSIGGFSALFADWLGEFFGIPFRVKITERDELLAGLASGEIDFTGELVFANGQRENRFMAGPIAERPITIMRATGREPLPVPGQTRQARYAFLEGSVAHDLVLPYLPRDFYAVFVENTDAAYRLVAAGEVDAFIDKGITMMAFEYFDDLEIGYFSPVMYVPVSIATQNPELQPFVSAIQKSLNAGAMYHLSKMYSLGSRDYLRWQMKMRLSPAEREFIDSRGGLYNPIKIVAECCNYPVSFFNHRTGNWEGIVFDILREISWHTGLYFAVANEPGMSWHHHRQLVENGQALMFADLALPQDRGGGFIWADHPFQQDFFALISRAGMDPVRISELMRHRVGLVDGSAAAEMFGIWFPYHPGTVVYPYSSDAFTGLFRGEVDFVVATTRQLLAIIHYLERPGFKLNFVFENHSANSHFGFNADQTVLRSIVSKAQTLVDTRAIVTRWELRAFDYRAKMAEVRLPWLIGALVLSCFVLFLVLVMMHRSRREGKRLERLVAEQTMDLQIASEEAIAASYVKSEFLANMSHEIRTPLNAVIGMTAIARSSDDLNRIYDCLRKIDGASQQLMKVINDVLDVSKIEARKFEMANETFIFETMMNNIKNIIEVRATEKKLHLAIDFDEHIPRALVGDEMRLSQVLINLLSNAVKFTPEDGTVRFAARHISRRDNRELIEFMVWDSGIGISEEQQKKMFDAFAQADSGVANRFGGTGLGLPISKSFVDLMGGEIFVESSIGMGTCFTVQIPFEVGDPDIVERSRDLRSPSRLNFEGRTILLVEDVEINREITIALFEDTGVAIDCAEDGQIAVDMFIAAPDRYDLIFMDIQMPVLDGYTATRAIRALDIPQARIVPIVAMTANAFADDIERCREVGMNDHVAKPIEIDILLNTAAKYLSRERA